MLQAVRLITEMARTSDDRFREEGGSNSDEQSSSFNIEAGGLVLFREIHKNGWLRRTHSVHKPDKDISRCWVAFCVHDETEPHFEGFIDQKQATSHIPIWTLSLKNVLYVSPTLCATSKNEYEFCVNFSDDQILRLAAPTHQSMLDWVHVLTRKLTDMNILRPKENLYSKGPERIATRDPTSPLPPPPNLGQSNIHFSVNSSLPSTSSAPTIFIFDDVVMEERRTAIRHPRNLVLSPSPSPRLTVGTSNIGSNENSSYESIFLASSVSVVSEQERDDNATISRPTNNTDEGEQYAALIECRTSENSETNANVTTTPVTLASMSTIATMRQSRQVRTQLTMREQQVLQLQKEMNHPSGVRLKMGRRDCKDGIAFVDCFGAVWIGGWKHKEHPLLYNVLHIGDLVISIAGIRLNGVTSIRNILKNYTFPCVEMIVRRLPHGRVMTLTRSMESEDFGLEVGSSNEVVSVSISVQSLGLSAFTNPVDPSVGVGTTVKWILTEVNNRPLNLYEACARERMNALGRDVSIVLQPSDLVNAIKKKLRTIRSYKNFVL